MNTDIYRQILNDEKRLTEIARQNFNMIDTDGSGKIDVKELSRAMEKTSADFGLPSPTKENELKEFQSLDVDGNGQIDFNEFLKYIRRSFEILAY